MGTKGLGGSILRDFKCRENKKRMKMIKINKSGRKLVEWINLNVRS